METLEQAGPEVTENASLKALECLGEGSAAAQKIFAMIGHSRFFSDFTRSDIEMLASAMTIYRAEAEQTLIREGDIDDYMLLIIEGARGDREAGSPGAAPGHDIGRAGRHTRGDVDDRRGAPIRHVLGARDDDLRRVVA
ncbi:MAG: hypothetical protein U1F52_08890 [Burkholderiales bacterium]